MPGLDRTGPEGQGSRTGRQMGKCTPRDKQQDATPENKKLKGGEMNPGRGRGKGLGRGLGRNRRNWE